MPCATAPRAVVRKVCPKEPGILQHRQPIALIEAYRPSDREDAEARRRMLDFARREPDCLLRRCAEGHFTASAWVLAPAGERVLLMLHRKLGKWLQPGGHADGEADLEAVARRELLEETGLDDPERLEPVPFDLDVHRIPARPGEPAHLHYDVRFLMRARAEGPLILSDESHEVAWRALGDIPALGEESLARMARKTPAPTP